MQTQQHILLELQDAAEVYRDMSLPGDDKAVQARITKLLLLQDVLCASNDLPSLSNSHRLGIEDGAHIVRETCRALRTKVYYNSFTNYILM